MDTTWHDDDLSISKKAPLPAKNFSTAGMSKNTAAPSPAHASGSNKAPIKGLTHLTAKNADMLYVNEKKKGKKKIQPLAPQMEYPIAAPPPPPAPIKVSQEYLSSPRVAYLVMGEQRADRPTLVFVHGLHTDSTIWKYQQDYFSKHTQTVAIDFPGHGLSPSDETMSYEDILHAVITHLKVTSLILIGWQYGCSSVLAYLMKYPNRARKAVLINASPLSDSLVYPENINAFFPELGIFKGKDLNYIEGNRTMFEDVVKKNSNSTYSLSAVKQDKSSIDTPVLIIFGGRDRVAPFTPSLELRTQIKNSMICELENSGHIPLITTSNSLNTHILRFVRV